MIDNVYDQIPITTYLPLNVFNKLINLGWESHPRGIKKSRFILTKDGTNPYDANVYNLYVLGENFFFPLNFSRFKSLDIIIERVNSYSYIDDNIKLDLIEVFKYSNSLRAFI